MKNLHIRKANLHDCEDIFKWRNDRLTRKMSKNIKEVEWNEHLNWYKETIKNKDILLLVCTDNKNFKKLGMVRFDILNNGKSSEISINLNPKERNKDHSTECIKKSIKFMMNKFIIVRALLLK